MYIIICLDDNNGLAFNHRRQSQDRIVAEDIRKTVGEKKLWITDYSRKLFQAVSNLEISENPKEEAKKGEGFANPNPLVGAVIVKKNKILGIGYHKKYGENHAEINAILNAKKKKNNIENATIYVNLEPCSHYGKTPPCADAIIKNKFKRVVIGCLDSNKKVAGNGIKKLREAKIEVIENILEEECKKLNEVFFHYII